MTLTQEEAEALYWQADKKHDNCDYGGCLKDATDALGAFLELKNKEWEGNGTSMSSNLRGKHSQCQPWAQL